MSGKSATTTSKSSSESASSSIIGRKARSIKKSIAKKPTKTHAVQVEHIKSARTERADMLMHHHAYKSEGRVGMASISALCDTYTDFSNWSACVAAAHPTDRINLVRRGVASRVLVLASDYFNMPRSTFVEYIGMSSATAERKIKSKAILGQAESERLERIALIEDAASNVFDDADMAKEWLLSKNAALGATPLSMLDTETGAGEVRKILNAIAYGGVV